MICKCYFNAPKIPFGRWIVVKRKEKTSKYLCFIDVQYKHILTTKIVETTVNEIDLVIEHLKNLKQRLDITKLITALDWGCPSIELIIKTIYLDYKSLIQLPKNIYRYSIK